MLDTKSIIMIAVGVIAGMIGGIVGVNLYKFTLLFYKNCWYFYIFNIKSMEVLILRGRLIW